MALIPPAPETLENGDRRVGEALFQLKIPQLGRVAIDVYKVAFFVDAPAAAEALRPFAGRTHEALCADPAFFTRFTEGRFRRTHFLSMARSVPAVFMQRGWRQALSRYVGAGCAEAGRIVSMVPSLAAYDTLAVCFDGDGETVEMSKNRGAPLGTVRSRELWLAFQRIYFDEDTEAPLEVKNGVVQRLPEVLWSGAAVLSNARQEAEAAALQAAAEKEVEQLALGEQAAQQEAERSVVAARSEVERAAKEREAAAAARAAAAQEAKARELERARKVAVAVFLRGHGFNGVDIPRRPGGCAIMPKARTTYALHCAAETGDSKMVEMLLLEGASAGQENSSGQTAAEVARTAQRRGRKGSFAEVLRLLDAGLHSATCQQSLGGA